MRMQGIDGCWYMVYNDEAEADEHEDEFPFCPRACFNGYMNAFCLGEE